MAALLALLALLSSAGNPHNRVAIVEPCHSKRRRKDLTGGSRSRAGGGTQCAVSGRKLTFEVLSSSPATHVLSFELNGVRIRDFPVATLPLSHSNGDGKEARRGNMRRLPLRIDNMLYGRNVARIALHDAQGHAILSHDQVAFLLIEPWGGRGARSCGDAQPEAEDDSEATSSPQCVHAAALPAIAVTAPRYVARAAVFTAAECDRIIASALMLGSDTKEEGGDETGFGDAVVGEDAADNTNAAVADRDYRRTQRVFMAPERGRGHASRKGAGDDLRWIYDRVRAFAGTINRQHWQFALGGVPGSNATLLLENGTERRRRRRRWRQRTGLGTDSNESIAVAVDEFACRPHEVIQVGTEVLLLTCFSTVATVT